MPSGVSDYGSRAWLSALFGVEPLPDRYFVALCVREPGSLMDGTMVGALEPADQSYARPQYGVGGTYWAPNGPYLTNLQPVTFNVPVQDWGYLTHFALLTAADQGQLYAWGALFNPQFVSRSIGMFIPPGGLVLGLHALDNTIAV